MIDVRMKNIELFELYEELMRLTQDPQCGNNVLIEMFGKIRNVLLNSLQQAFPDELDKKENIFEIYDTANKKNKITYDQNRLMKLAGLIHEDLDKDCDFDRSNFDNSKLELENKKRMFESWERHQKSLIEQLDVESSDDISDSKHSKRDYSNVSVYMKQKLSKNQHWLKYN